MHACVDGCSPPPPPPQVRDWIVPTNRRYPLDMLLGTLRSAFPYGQRKGDDFVVIEYVLLRGVNDR